jgi:hypothetical protein
MDASIVAPIAQGVPPGRSARHRRAGVNDETTGRYASASLLPIKNRTLRQTMLVRESPVIDLTAGNPATCHVEENPAEQITTRLT